MAKDSRKKAKKTAQTPRQAHEPKAKKETNAKQRDPIGIIEQSNQGRLEELVPIRHSRMGVSPFTFYRGGAAIMAADLSLEEHSGIVVQSCGDCHILNCGAFSTPERNVIIDINDFDETHPAPFEWDLKRLATSLVLATDTAGMSAKAGENAAYEMIRSYQKEMANYAGQRLLDIWYSRLDYQEFIDRASNKDLRKSRSKNLAKEILKSSPETLQEKLIEKKAGAWRFKEMPPLLYHMKDSNMKHARKAFDLYLESMAADRAALLRQFEIVDLAIKVVGTGSVGTFCAVILLVGTNDDFLILQVKEAQQSVFEPYTGESEFKNHGQRVVVGQRIMQSASDMFLGWTKGESGKHFYLRQLRDVKMSPVPEMWDKRRLADVSALSGKILAKAHAKLGAAPAITEFIGPRDTFAKAMSTYALAYAEQTLADYGLFVEACRSRRLPTEASAVG